MSERTPLLPTASSTTTTTAPKPKRRPSPSSPSGSATLHHSSPFSTDELAIEGLVLALLHELDTRGYPIPLGLIELPEDMNEDELQGERRLYSTVWKKEGGRCKNVLDECLPPRNTTSTVLPDGTALSLGGLGNGEATGTSTPTHHHITPQLIPHPTALFLCGLLSLLITLQAEPTPSVQETDPGVDGELRMFKARRELGEKLYAVVGALLDSYLLSGDGGAATAPGGAGDALVTLLFRDYPLNYDSIDRATCALDLLLNLSSYPLVEAEELISHPVVLASTEYVWRNGLLPQSQAGELMSWRDAGLKIDRFSVPRILHTQTYLLSTIHAFITVYILMFSAYAHFDSLNPLAPDVPQMKIPEIPEHGRPEKTWSLLSAVVWWLWVAGVLGWAGEVGRIWHHRGPHPSLPLSPSTLLPLIHHALVLLSVVLRFSLLLFRRPSSIILSTSLSILAWSIPFLAASRILPQNLPAFGSPTHLKFEKIRDGRKRRDVGYRSPPKTVPESHRALRSLEAHLGGLVQFGTYFLVFGLLLLWSLSGELDYPSVLMRLFWLPLTLLKDPNGTLATTSLSFQSAIATATPSEIDTLVSPSGALSPIEARTTLAFTLILGVVLAYFAGGRPSISGKPFKTPHNHRKGLGLEDLDGWDRYGREVAFRARRERLAVTRYFTFVPPKPLPDTITSSATLEEIPVPSAFSTPPLPSPLNLMIPPILLGAGIAKGMGKAGLARMVNERGRLWAWRIGLFPLGVWAVVAKGVRTLRGRD